MVQEPVQTDTLNWLGISDHPDPPRYVPVERIQEKEMERLLGYELNLWLMWRVYATEKTP